MELIVKAISKTGKNAGRGLLATDGKWYNAGKGVDDFNDLNPGDVLDADVSGNFVNAFKVSTAAPAKAQFKTAPASGDRDGQISRGAALKSVLSSSYYNDLVKDKSVEEATATFIKVTDALAKYMREGA